MIGQTSLHLAAENGDENTALALVQGGVDVKAKDQEGRTALHLAAENGHEEVVRLFLIGRRSPITAKDNKGRTPLHLAARNKHKAVIEQLLLIGYRSPSSTSFPFLFDDYYQRREHVNSRPLGEIFGVNQQVNNREGLLWLVGEVLREADWLVTGARLTEDQSLALESIADELSHSTQLSLQSLSGSIRGLTVDKNEFAPRSALFMTESVIQDKTRYLSLKMPLEKLGKLAGIEDLDENGRTALHWVMENENGIAEIIQLLVGMGATVDIPDKDGRTPLYHAVAKGNQDITQLLVGMGATVNIPDKNGRMPLYHAVESGNQDIVRLLVEKGTNVKTEDGQRALRWAVDEGSKEILQLLLNKDVDIKTEGGQRALRWTIDTRSKEILKLLVNKDVNIKTENGQRALRWAVDEGSKEILQLLLNKDVDIKTEGGQRALRWAIDTRSKEILKLLVNKDVNIKTENGQRALCWAMDEGSKEMLLLLVKKGAEINMPCKDKWTALQMAVSRNKCELVQVLLENGVDVKSQGGIKALHWASNDGYVNIVTLLVEKGADVNAKLMKAEETALHMAVKKDNNGRAKQVVEVLLQKADVNQQNKDGQTALHLAVDNELWDVAKLLVKNGGDLRKYDNKGQMPLDLMDEERKQQFESSELREL